MCAHYVLACMHVCVCVWCVWCVCDVSRKWANYVDAHCADTTCQDKPYGYLDVSSCSSSSDSTSWRGLQLLLCRGLELEREDRSAWRANEHGNIVRRFVLQKQRPVLTALAQDLCVSECDCIRDSIELCCFHYLDVIASWGKLIVCLLHTCDLFYSRELFIINDSFHMSRP